MKKQVIALLVLLVLALLLSFVLWMNARNVKEELHEHVQFEQELESALTNNSRDYEQQLSREQAARREAERLAQHAQEAQRLDALRAAERENKLKALNEQLEREAIAREQAEIAAAALAERMRELRESKEITAERSSDEQETYDHAAALISEREAELAALEQQALALDERRQQAEQRQVELEEAIFEAGGTITIQNYDIRSHNDKRRSHIMFRERVLRKD